MTGPGTTEPFERRPRAPRRVRNGLRIRADDEQAGGNRIAARWREMMERLIPAPTRSDALEYARLGQTIHLDIGPGSVDGSVQGRRARPYAVRLRFPRYSEDQWTQVIDAMANEAIYAAKLLAHEVPAAVDDLFGSFGLRLVPDADEIGAECECRMAAPCKHAASSWQQAWIGSWPSIPAFRNAAVWVSCKDW